MQQVLSTVQGRPVLDTEFGTKELCCSVEQLILLFTSDNDVSICRRPVNDVVTRMHKPTFIASGTGAQPCMDSLPYDL